jgi:hypothetical protein
MLNRQQALEILLTELFKADRILKNGLALMTPEQQNQWAAQNNQDDLLNDGGTIRSNERENLFKVLKAEGVAFCRACGCTNYCACQPPCSWAENDLCSACVTRRQGGQNEQ